METKNNRTMILTVQFILEHGPPWVCHKSTTSLPCASVPDGKLWSQQEDLENYPLSEFFWQSRIDRHAWHHNPKQSFEYLTAWHMRRAGQLLVHSVMLQWLLLHENCCLYKKLLRGDVLGFIIFFVSSFLSPMTWVGDKFLETKFLSPMRGQFHQGYKIDLISPTHWIRLALIENESVPSF